MLVETKQLVATSLIFLAETPFRCKQICRKMPHMLGIQRRFTKYWTIFVVTYSEHHLGKLKP